MRPEQFLVNIHVLAKLNYFCFELVLFVVVYSFIEVFDSIRGWITYRSVAFNFWT